MCEWSHNKLSRILEMYVLSANRVGVLLGAHERVCGKMSVLRVTLNLCCDCEYGPHNKPKYVMLHVSSGVVVLFAWSG